MKQGRFGYLTMIRCTWQSVMGSKNLKAVAVLGTSNPKVADPKALKKLNRLTMPYSSDRTAISALPFSSSTK